MRRFFATITMTVALLAAGLGFAEAKAVLVAAVDISTQKMTVSYSGRVVDRWKVSTAARGYLTPTGAYRPTRMHKMWYSKKYDNSPMPYSIFFRGGYAIHGTGSIKRLGTPASHGCVRLHPSNAAKLFTLVKQAGAGNTQIVINR